MQSFLVQFLPFSAYVTASFIVGIICAPTYTMTTLCLVACICCLFLSNLFTKIQCLVLIITMLTGASIAKHQQTTYRQTKQLLTTLSPFSCTCYVNDNARLYHDSFKTKLVLSEIKPDIIPATLSYTMVLYLPYPLLLQAGDYIHIHNLSVPPTKDIYYEHYLIKEGIIASLFPKKFHYTMLHPAHVSPFALAAYYRNRLVQRLQTTMSPPTFTLFNTLYLGNKNVPQDEFKIYKRLFARWGISHYIARSGLHVSIIVMVSMFLLSLFSISLHIQRILLLLLIFLYSLLSWPSVSFIRALMTFITYTAITFVKVRLSSLDIVCIIALILLSLNPLNLFFLDFQLSFGLTFAFAWLNHIQRLHKYRAMRTSLDQNI